MIKQFLLNSGLLLLLNILIKPIYVIGIEREVQNLVGASSYGLYFTLIGFVYIFQFINEFGFAQFLRKYISETRLEIPQVFSNILMLKMLLSFAFIASIVLFNKIFNYEVHDLGLLLLIALSFVISAFIQVYRSGLTGMGHYLSDSILSIIDKLLLVIFCSAFLFTSYRFHFDIYTFVYCQLASLSLTWIAGMIMFHTRVHIIWKRFNTQLAMDFLTKAAPFAIIIFLMSTYSRLDGIMLRELLPDGVRHAGSYAAGYRLFEAANMFAFLIAALLLPMASYMLSVKESLDELINLSVRIIVIMTIGSAVISSFYSNEIMQLLYVEYEQHWGAILFWLMLGFVPLGLGHIFGVLMMAANQIRGLNKIYLFALITNFVLNMVLIPKMQAVGAAISTFVTQLLVIIGQVWLFSRAYKWQLHRPVQFVIFILGSIIAVYVIKLYGPSVWMLNAMISCIAIVAFGMLCNMLPIAELRGYVSRKRG